MGVHTSIAGGLEKGLDRAAELGCGTLQIFSHNPRGWAVTGRTRDEGETFRKTRQRYGLGPVFIHSSYLINLASPRTDLLEKSVAMVVEELNIADAIGAEYIVLHTGSASGDDPPAARKRAMGALTEVSRRGTWRAGILLENTAGERGDITSNVRDISEIMRGVPEGLVAGLCLDTCHAFAAGYDIGSAGSLSSLESEIGEYIGLDRLHLIHLNDSKGELGSRRDRHEHIGRGRIGLKGFSLFLSRPFFSGIPLILETPKKKETDDPMNLRVVRRLIRNVPGSKLTSPE